MEELMKQKILDRLAWAQCVSKPIAQRRGGIAFPPFRLSAFPPRLSASPPPRLFTSVG